jgi:hypothetical protein
MKKIIILFSVLLAAIACQQTSEVVDDLIPSDEGLFPFVISYEMAKGAATDFSPLLEAPAGKDGFIRVENGHFVNDKGRVRLNATNLTAAANFPTHEQAERVAERIANFGINCVRLHYMDWPYGPEGFPLAKEPSIFAKDGSERNLDPEMLDRLEYLIAQFKQRGIYVDVNLYVARYQYHYKGQNAINTFIQSKEREYAKDLLTHVNPYTGLPLAKDPVVAVVELNNEDALFTTYCGGNLVPPGWPTMADIKGTEMPEAKKREFYKTLLKYEADHWNNMRTYLKKDLGVMAPVTSTQVSYSQPSTFDGMDFYDNHAYWLHPTIGVYWKQNTAPMVNEPNGGTLPGLASRRFAGKPYTISEYNHPYPSFYGAEGQPMLHAYAAFQGWDGVFAYSWNNRINEEPQSMEYFFSYAARTDCLAHFNACAAMFLRGDVQEAEDGVTAIVPLKAFEDEWVKKPTRNGDIFTLLKDGTGMTKQDMLLHKTTVDVHADKSVAVKASEPAAVKISDTKQIEWNNEDPENGMFMVKTPNVKVFSGFPKGRVADLGDGVTLNIGKTKLGWATISLTSKEGNGFEKGTSLLVATGYTHNKDAKFKRELDKDGNPTTTISSRWYEWGTGPMMTEGIPATVTLPSAAEATTCWALDESGARKVEVPVTKGADGKAVVEIGDKYQTVWYEISVK